MFALQLKCLYAASGLSLWWSRLGEIFLACIHKVCVCVRVLVKITLRYLTWESATVSTIVPIYRNNFIISPRTCTQKSNISTEPREDTQRRKQERDYIGFGLAEQQSGGGEKKAGILDGEVEAIVRISVFSYLLKLTWCEKAFQALQQIFDRCSCCHSGCTNMSNGERYAVHFNCLITYFIAFRRTSELCPII